MGIDLTDIVSALTGRNWIALQAAILVAVVAVLRRPEARISLARWVPFFGSRWGGYTMTFAIAGLATIGGGFASGWSTDLISQALLNGVSAAFGWNLFKDLKPKQAPAQPPPTPRA